MLIRVRHFGAGQNPRIILQRRKTSTLTNLSSTAAPGFVFRSTSTDPYFNLSIEHYLFQNCPAGTRVLFLYVNRPCVVIGRNQNPWVEVNISNLRRGLRGSTQSQSSPIDLVRRRSGGGTVFHDEGNVNWSVLCDLNEFTRDKHAEMVVRALRKLAIDRARVNERHDIVLDQGDEKTQVVEDDMHVSPYTRGSSVALKVSGSAYKIAKNRVLHHGTALAESPNLNFISDILQSPARKFITAKGVESVRSPVSNLGVTTKMFESTVESEFRRMYGVHQDDYPTIHLGEGCLQIESIRSGYKELKSEEWTYLQTPQFNFSFPFENMGAIDLFVKQGIIRKAEWKPSTAHILDSSNITNLMKNMCDKELHRLSLELQEFRAAEATTEQSTDQLRRQIVSKITELLPGPH